MIGAPFNDRVGGNRPANDWFSPGRFAVFLGALILICFPSVLLGTQSFYVRDFGYFGYPLATYHRECFWHGEIPLWNPLSSNGLPFLAQWNTLVLYPGSFIYLLLPLPWSLNLFCLVHLFFAGLGAYFLARHWTNDALAACVAGVAFTFNGLTLNCLMWPNNIAALGCMPWVVLLTEKACREGGRKIILAALVGAMQMLSGAPEIILLTWVLIAGLVIGHSCSNFGRWHFTARPLICGAVVVALVSGLAAAQLLPFLDLLKYSQRDQSTADTISWSMPVWGWANFLVPLFRCQRSGAGVFFQIGQDWTSSYYLGVGTLALALLAAARVRSRRVWLLAAMFGLSLVLALGDQGHLYTWIRKVIPQFGLLRFAVKFVVLAVFCAPFLAAFAISHQHSLADSTTIRSWRRSMAILAALLLIAIGAIIWCSYHFPLSGEPYSATWSHGLGRAIFLVLILGMALGLKHWRPARAPWFPGLALLLFLWLDVWTHAPSQNPTIKPDLFAPDVLRERWHETKLAPEPAPGGVRAWTPRYAYDQLLRTMISEPEKDFLIHRLALFANCNLVENAPIVDGFFSLHLSEQRDIWSMLYFASSTTNAAHVLDLAGVGAISSPTNIVAWDPRPTALPLVTIGQLPRYANPDATLASLTKRDFDPRQIIYLPTDATTVITATNPAQAQIVSQTFAAHRIELETSSDAPALVHFSQSFYHPWHAYLDNQPVAVWRANHAFQAVEVPAGKHRLQMVYEDLGFHVGVVISSLTLLICAMLWRTWKPPLNTGVEESTKH